MIVNELSLSFDLKKNKKNIGNLARWIIVMGILLDK